MFRKICISFILLIIFQSRVWSTEIRTEPKNKDNFERLIDDSLNPSCVPDGCNSLLGVVSYTLKEDNDYRSMTIVNKENLTKSFPTKTTYYKESFSELEKFLNGKKILLDENITNLGTVFRRSDDVIEYDLKYAGEINGIHYPKTNKARAVYAVVIDSHVSPFIIQVYANRKETWNNFVENSLDDFVLLEIAPVVINIEIEKQRKTCFKNTNPTNCLIQAIKKNKKIQKTIYKETQQLVQTFELK